MADRVLLLLFFSREAALERHQDVETALEFLLDTDEGWQNACLMARKVMHFEHRGQPIKHSTATSKKQTHFNTLDGIERSCLNHVLE